VTRILRILAGLLIAGLLTVAVTGADELPDDEAIPGGHFYRQTGQETGNGYAVTNNDGITFYETFQRLGLSNVGYPVSHRFLYAGLTTQAFQKVVMQWNPTTNSVQFLNILDILNVAGLDGALAQVRQVPVHVALAADGQYDPSTPAGFEAIVNNHLAILDQNPTIKARFLAETSWLELYGLPISYGDFGNVQVLRSQRQVFQVWTAAGGGCPLGEACLGNTGDFMKEFNIFTGAAVQPVSIEQARAGYEVTDGTPALASDEEPEETEEEEEEEAATEPVIPEPVPGLVGYGMQAHMLGGRANAATDKIVEAGFNWTKQQFRWSEIEPSRGVYNWAAYDEVVNTASAKGLKLLVSVVSAPSWSLAPGVSHGPPAVAADIAPFMTTLIQRYPGKVHAVEVWNEANLFHEWGFLDSSAFNHYGQMLKAAYQAIKAVDPSVTVLFGAPTPTGVNDPNIGIDDATYVRRAYEEFPGIGNFFDAIGIHPNGGANAPDDTLGGANNRNVPGWNNHASFFFTRFVEIKAIMVGQGDPNKPIWFTEFGWSSTPASETVPSYEYSAYNTHQDQATFLVRAFQKVRNEYPYVTHMFVWNLNFQSVVGPTDEKYGFGILHSSGGHRPAYDALKAMSK